MSQPLSYLDPGSASYLLQLLVAGALGALFVLRGVLRGFLERIGHFLAEVLLRRPRKGKDDEEE